MKFNTDDDVTFDELAGELGVDMPQEAKDDLQRVMSAYNEIATPDTILNLGVIFSPEDAIVLRRAATLISVPGTLLYAAGRDAESSRVGEAVKVLWQIARVIDEAGKPEA